MSSSTVSSKPFSLDPIQSIVLMFAITQVLALSAGILLLTAAAQNPVVNNISVAPTQEPENPLNAVVFIAYVLLGAGAALFAIRFLKGRMAFRLLEFAMLTGSVSVIFIAALLGLAHLDFILAVGLSGFAGLLFAFIKFFFIVIMNQIF